MKRTARRPAIWVLCYLLWLHGRPAPALSGADTTRTIGTVTIVRRQVFDPTEKARFARFPYPVLDHLHLQTRPGVIRRELLFRPGDPFDPALAEESARNLRRYAFLGHVEIEAIPRAGAPASADTVDLRVIAADQWSTDADVLVDRRGNLSRLGIGVEEENLLGLGKYLNLRYQTSTDRTLWRTIYRDPQLLGSRWTLDAREIRATDGSLTQLAVERPFYSLSSTWSLRASGAYETAPDQLYDDGRLSVALQRQVRTVSLTAARGWRRGEYRQHLSLGLTGESRRFPDPPRVDQPAAPSAVRLLRTGVQDRQEVRAEAGWELQPTRFTKRRFIDRAGLIEDIRLGTGLSAGAGWALGVGPNDPSFGLLSLSATQVLAAGQTQLWVFSVDAGTRARRQRLDNGELSAFFHHYYQGLPSQTWVLGAAWHRTWRMEQPYQLVLGEDVGLRGYPARQFTGDRLLLFNLEDRVFTPWELGTLRLGFAPFADAGMTWEPEAPFRWGDLRPSAGLSLRLGVPKFGDAPVFRFDLAWPLRRPRDTGRYSLSFSFSPIFKATEGPQDRVRRF